MRGERDDADHGAGEEEEDELPPQIAELAQANVPNSVRSIRACKRCGILKTIEQFINEGCENCPFLEMVSSAKFFVVEFVVGLFFEGRQLSQTSNWHVATISILIS